MTPPNGRSRPTGQQGDSQEPQEHRNTILDQALAQATRGRRVFQLKPGTKNDPLSKWRHGGPDEIATTDLDEVRRRWDRVPNANLGIETGAESGLVVVDVDGPEGEKTLARLEAVFGKLPATLEVKTNRGRQLWFLHPGGYVKNRQGSPRKDGSGGWYPFGPDQDPAYGVDIRGDGGMVCAPPSVVDGVTRAYANELEPAELPERWIELLQAEPPASLGSEELAQALDKIRTEGEPCDCMERALDKHAQHEGGRHEAMITAQQSIVHLGREQHPGAGQALDRLQTAFLSGKPGAETEWTNALGGAVAAAMATEPEATGCPYVMKEHLDENPDPGQSLAEIGIAYADGRKEKAEQRETALATVTDDEDTTWKPVDLSAVLAGTWTPPQASIGRRSDGVALLYPGREHAVAAEPEAGKTWLLCQVTVDELTAGGRVLYIDFEDDEQEIVGRLLALGADPAVLGDMTRFKYVRPSEAIATSDEMWRKRMAELLDFDGQGPTLAVLDGVTEGYGMHGWSIDSNDDSPKWRLAFIKPALRAGAATLASDHVVKNPDNRRGFAIGAQHKKAGLTGALFGLVSITPFGRGLLGRSELIIYKDRRGGLRQYGVRRDDGYVHLADLILDARDEGQIEIHDDGSTDKAGVTFEIRAPEQAADGAKDSASAKLNDMVQRIEEILAKRGPMIQSDLRAAVRGRAKYVDEAVQYMITAKALHEGIEVQGKAKRRHLPHQCRKGFKCFTDPFS